jgi:signal transduction histidine kinase
VASVAVVLFALPLGLVLQRSYRDDELLRLQRDTVADTRGIDISEAPDPVELPSTRDTLAVYAKSGRRVAGVGPPAADRDVRSALLTGKAQDRAGDGVLYVAVPLLSNERVVGAVRAVRADSRVAARTRQAWALLAGAALALVVLSIVAALVLGRRLALPLERLTATARRLGDGDFSVRAPRSDVSEIDAVGRALDATAERLDTMLEHERAFTADTSHQLRTPLAALRIELESLELDGVAPERVAVALDQAARLEQTIETLVAVRRDGHRNAGPADLRPLLDAVEADWRGRLAAVARPLNVRAPEHPVRALVSAEIVREILEVLVDNACVHGAGSVNVTMREMPGAVAVDVADEGKGFADVASAFARERRNGQAHGIGLPLARSLAEAEGGSLQVSRAAPRPVVTLLLRA